MTKYSFDKITIKLKGQIRNNFGSSIIVGLMILLVAVVSLSAGWFFLIDNLGVYVYYALVIGVFLQLACFIKYRSKNYGEVVV